MQWNQPAVVQTTTVNSAHGPTSRVGNVGTHDRTPGQQYRVTNRVAATKTRMIDDITERERARSGCGHVGQTP